MKIVKLILGFCIIALYSQSQEIKSEVIGSSGQRDSIGPFLVSWTIGEPFIENFCNANCIVSQGFHQSYYQIVQINENREHNFQVDIFPNPAVDILNVDLSGIPNNTDFQIWIYNLKGEALLSEEYGKAGIKKIHLKSFPDGMMILKVTDPVDSVVASFKIIKVNH